MSKKNGTKVLIDGRSGKEILRIHAKGRAVQPKGATPFGTATGNCGASSIELYRTGGANLRVDTGFSLRKTSVAWSWAFNVHAEDRRGAYNWDWDDEGAMLGTSNALQ